MNTYFYTGVLNEVIKLAWYWLVDPSVTQEAIVSTLTRTTYTVIVRQLDLDSGLIF